MVAKDRVQLLHPIRQRWVKLDTRTGRLLAEKRSPGPWANIETLSPGAAARRLPAKF